MNELTKRILYFHTIGMEKVYDQYINLSYIRSHEVSYNQFVQLFNYLSFN